MRENERNYVVVGGFVLLMLGALVLGLALLAGRTGATDQYYSNFENVAGIVEGSRVLYEGYPVGQVGEITPAGSGPTLFQVALHIRRGWRIPDDSEVRITASGLLAALTLDIDAGSSEVMLDPGDTIRASERDNLVAALSAVAEEVGGIVRDHVRPLLETIAERAPTILTNVEVLSVELKRAADQLNELLGAENREDVRQILVNLEGASRGADELVRAVGTTRDQLHALLVDVDALVQENRGNVEQALRDLRDSLASVAQHIDAMTHDLEGTTRNLNEFSRRIRQNPALLLRSSAPRDDGA